MLPHDQADVTLRRIELTRVDAQATTPRRRKNKPVDTRERVGSGRGGFSVVGAASAAAKARWARFKAMKAERGEDDDDDGPRRPRRPAARKDQQSTSKAAIETYTPGSKMEVKGTEYVVGDDEVELPDDDKGEAKVDKEGRLLGGTFRDRLYAEACPNRLLAGSVSADVQVESTGWSHSPAPLAATLNASTPSPSTPHVLVAIRTRWRFCGGAQPCSSLRATPRSGRCSSTSVA